MRKIILSNNRLTKVPNEIRQLNHLFFVDLRFNEIGDIESGAFKFPDNKFGSVDLGNNQIYRIEADAFQGKKKTKLP